jgi:probable HAF family extracellular repeat protein
MKKTDYLQIIRRFALTTSLSVALGFGSAGYAQAYSWVMGPNGEGLTRLGSLGGIETETIASAINDAGQIVGRSSTATGKTHAFLTGPNGVGMTDLGTLGGENSHAYAINDAGQVAGESETAHCCAFHAFITAPNGKGMTEFLPIAGAVDPYHSALGINNAARVVGSSRPDDFTTRVLITGPNGVGRLDNGRTDGFASAINDAGQSVGTLSPIEELTHHAFITEPNTATVIKLGTLGGGESHATDVNASGQVVGWSLTAGGEFHAFITGPDGAGMTDLGTLGGTVSMATGINDAGQVVGYSTKAEGAEHYAFVTGPAGTGMTDLNSLVTLPDGLTLSRAQGINNSGQIIAVSPAIPEPATYAMMLAGLGLLGFMAKRVKSNRQSD